MKKAKERGEVHRGSGNYESDEAKENARLKKELRDTKDALEEPGDTREQDDCIIT